MNLAVGFPAAGGEETLSAFVLAVEENLSSIEELYFALPGDASGRAPARDDGMMSAVLPHLRSLGLRHDLLFNANCYGADARSGRFAADICCRVESARAAVGVDIVTTTSPFIAQTIRSECPDMELRASVNMRIGTVQGMELVADLFDGFYAQRDYNRDMGRLLELRDWCRRKGKKLCGLANSGCLAFCSGQTFHDNLVAHEGESGAGPAAEPFTCRRYLKDRHNWPALLAATWIRPEDLGRYEGVFDLAKVASRMHRAPARVIRAYARGRYRGNLLDLLEPGHGDVAPGLWLDNAAFPADWFARSSDCGRNCDSCKYCASVLDHIRIPTQAQRSAPTCAERAYLVSPP